MAEAETIVIISGPHSAHLTGSDLALLAEALRRVLLDPQQVSRAGVPAPLAADLPASLGDPTWFQENAEVRAGPWLLVATADGLEWQYRIVAPASPRVGLMLSAPARQTEAGWVVERLRFMRLR